MMQMDAGLLSDSTINLTLLQRYPSEGGTSIEAQPSLIQQVSQDIMFGVGSPPVFILLFPEMRIASGGSMYSTQTTFCP
jgi:hypothetical protein